MKKLAFILLLLLPFCVYSQLSHNLELRLYSGWVIPHRIGMESLAKKNPIGGEINYYFQRHTDNFYDTKYRFPLHGFGVSYEYLGNPEALGSACAVYSFMDFDLFSRTHFMINFRANAGLAYLTKVYDKIQNSENIAISTHLCFYFNINAGVVYKFNSGYQIKLSGGMVHYSNGSVRKPNLGLNQLFISLAASKEIATTEIRKQTVNYQDKLSPHEAWIMGTLVSSDEFSVQPDSRGGGFLCSTVAAGYNYQYGKIGKVGVSVDMFYNENLKYNYDAKRDTLVCVNETFADVMRLGIGVGHQLVYKRFELVSFVGTYFYNKAKKSDHIYTRIGARYYIADFMFINLTLKAKGFKAQFIECGLGFSCRKWKKE